MSYKVCEINDINEFFLIKEEWNRLLSESDVDQPFLRHEWLTVWWKHFGGNNTLAVILIKDNDNDTLALAAPLMELRNTKMGIGVIILQSLTNFHSNNYNFIFAKAKIDVVGVFYEYLKRRPRRWDLMQLQEIPTHTNNFHTILDGAKRAGYKTESWRRGDAPHLPIINDWDAYFLSLKSKFRSNLRNRTKRLAKEGEIEHVIIERGGNIDSALAKGLEIEKKSWKGVSKSAIACDPILTSFYTEIAKVAEKERWLRLSFLKVGGDFAAFDFSLIYNKTLYCLKIGYDPLYKPYSVGQLLCKENIKKSFDEKLLEYDFLGEMTKQKSDWTTNTHHVMWGFIYNFTAFGRIHYIYKFIIKQKLKRLKNKQ